MKKSFDFLLTRLTQQASLHEIDRFVVAAVISKDMGKKVLCLKRSADDFMPGLYELPSGKVEKNENILTALQREIQEETHLENTDVVDYLSYFDYLSRSGKKTRQFNFVVACDNIKTLALDEKEHEGYSWCAVHELNRYNISAETKQVIQTFFLRQGLKQTTTDQLLQGWKQGVEQFVVGGVVAHHSKGLILKRASDDFMGGIYELPSGKLEGGESVEMGVVREIEEETSLVVQGLSGTLDSFDYQSGSGKLTRQLNYQIQVENPSAVKLSDEHEGFAWVTSDELMNYPISKEVRAVLQDQLPKKSLKRSEEKTGYSSIKLFDNKRSRSPDPEEKKDQVSTKKPHYEGN